MNRRDQDGYERGFVDQSHSLEEALLLDRRYVRPYPDAPWALRPDAEVLSAHEYVRLGFVRWLLRTGRIEP
jgi:hypothetical protein